MSILPATERKPSEDVTHLFHDLLENQAFKSAPVLRSILLYLWQNQGEAFSEYAIAVDVLGRSADFDSKTDASVRVLIGRLRARLREFNASESYPLKLNIPVGTHELHWSLDGPAVPLASPEPTFPLAPPQASSRLDRRYLFGLTAVAMILAILCAVLFQQNRKLGAAQSGSVQIPRFWKSFLPGDRQPVVVLPSPVYLYWPEKNFLARDVTVADPAEVSSSPAMRELRKNWGPPEVNQGYIVLKDVRAGVQLINYFDAMGLHPQLIDSAHYQHETPEPRSTIFIGSANRTGYLSSLLRNTDFYVSDDPATPTVVHDRKPAAGQPAEYREIDYSASHKVIPGLIAMLPANNAGCRTLILLGRAPLGLASILVAPSGLERIDEEWRKAGSPSAWEMVVQVEVNQDTILKVSPVIIRAITSSGL